MVTLNNTNLYESDEVVAKYSVNSTRVRSLNNPERELIDRFDVKNKNVLVLGSGAGRVPANLLLYGNKVVGVDRSVKLTEAAKNNFPDAKFKDLTFMLADMTDLKDVQDEGFDVVIFPMNSLDYIDDYKMREKALLEATRKLKKGGLLAFSSHNKLAYMFSLKIRQSDRTFNSLFRPFHFVRESVVGGGHIFKGRPRFIIESTKSLTGLVFKGFICDSRNKFDRLFSRKMKLAQFLFPYILYVFEKNN
jgi:SAM-dependent methyltransferase